MRAILGALTAIAILAACPNGTGPRLQEVEWETSIQGAAGWEHLSGEATVHWTEGTQQFTTTMQIAGDQPGAVRPWHVHFNTCAQGGGIVGADGDYPRLNIGADGTATATTSVPAALSPTAPYHVNVHLSEAEMNIIIACGDLTSVGVTGQDPPPGQVPPPAPGY